jgi:hypothetical protein
MKKIFLSLFIVLVMTSCQKAGASAVLTNIPEQQTPISETHTPTALPVDELSSYYGKPQPAQIIINDQTYSSRIGTTKWITQAFPDGTTTTMIGDAFAIITPTQPVPVKSDLSMLLRLPIPINPTELWYILYKVSEEELESQDSTHGSFAWNPDHKTQMYIENYSVLLSDAQYLNFSLESGIYVFEVHASWGGKPPHTQLEADYGFLLQVQE